MNLEKRFELEVLILFGTRWKMVRNRDLTITFQAEIYVLVGVAWGEEKGNETQLASMFKQYVFYNAWKCLFKLYIHFENEHRNNADLGEIYRI